MSAWIARQPALVVIVVLGFVVAMTAYFATATRPPGAGALGALVLVTLARKRSVDPRTPVSRGASAT